MSNTDSTIPSALYCVIRDQHLYHSVTNEVIFHDLLKFQKIYLAGLLNSNWTEKSGLEVELDLFSQNQIQKKYNFNDRNNKDYCLIESCENNNIMLCLGELVNSVDFCVFFDFSRLDIGPGDLSDAQSFECHRYLNKIGQCQNVSTAIANRIARNIVRLNKLRLSNFLSVNAPIRANNNSYSGDNTSYESVFVLMF